MIQEKHILIDAGHGPLDQEGKYTTAPGKMFLYEPSLLVPDNWLLFPFTDNNGKNWTAFYEGVFNRLIAEKVGNLLMLAKVPFTFIHSNVADNSLTERVFIERTISEMYGPSNVLFVSSHSNASSTNTGTGIEVFTSRGQTGSDALANYFIKTLQHLVGMNGYNFKFRLDFSDGDADKEADFTVLKSTSCLAFLIEYLFFDNIEDVTVSV